MNPLHDFLLHQTRRQFFGSTGLRLSWMMNPRDRKVTVYRPDEQPIILDDPKSVSADPELPGFVLDMIRVWN